MRSAPEARPARLGSIFRAALPLLALPLLVLVAGCNDEPDLLAEHMRLGDEAIAEGRFTAAMAAYGHAHELAPTSARVQRAQMWARVFVMADTPARVGVESVEDIAYEAALLLKSRPLDKSREAACLTALGNVLARKGDAEGAKLKLAEAIKADPTSAPAHVALGSLLMARREGLAEAKAELELALAQKPDSATALAALGQIKLAEGDAAGAADRFEAALRKGDDFAARIGLGQARLQQAKYAEAIEQLQRASILDPKSADALSLLGQAQLGAGKLDDAERALRAAIAMRPDEATAIALGFALARGKKPEQALAVFGQVLTQSSSAASALYGAGVASEDLGRPEQALVFYRRVLALPAEGAQKALVTELQREAKGRIDVLPQPAPGGSTSAAASASASAAPRTPPR